MLNDILRAVGPALASAMAQKFESGEFRFGDSKFKFADFNFDNEFEGKRLEELDLTEVAPDAINLLGSTKLTLKQGKTFRVKASGEGADTLRFAMHGESLTIMRNTRAEQGDEPVELTVTLPEIRKVSVAGSGTITCDGLSGKAKAIIAGSGTIELTNVATDRLSVNVMGSGTIAASGSTNKLKLNIAGSGAAVLTELRADKAKISVAGSGRAVFASDGEVQAHLMGSGDVTVVGRATCSVHSMGSGKLNCVPPKEEPNKKAKAKTSKASKAKKTKAAKPARTAAKAKAAKKSTRSAKKPKSAKKHTPSKRATRKKD